MPARENGGTSRVDVTLAAATRPFPSTNRARSIRSIGRQACAISCRASSRGIVSLMGFMPLFMGLGAWDVWLGSDGIRDRSERERAELERGHHERRQPLRRADGLD